MDHSPRGKGKKRGKPAGGLRWAVGPQETSSWRTSSWRSWTPPSSRPPCGSSILPPPRSRSIRSVGEQHIVFFFWVRGEQDGGVSSTFGFVGQEKWLWAGEPDLVGAVGCQMAAKWRVWVKTRYPKRNQGLKPAVHILVVSFWPILI